MMRGVVKCLIKHNQGESMLNNYIQYSILVIMQCLFMQKVMSALSEVQVSSSSKTLSMSVSYVPLPPPS